MREGVENEKLNDIFMHAGYKALEKFHCLDSKALEKFLDFDSKTVKISQLRFESSDEILRFRFKGTGKFSDCDSNKALGKFSDCDSKAPGKFPDFHSKALKFFKNLNS